MAAVPDRPIGIGHLGSSGDREGVGDGSEERKPPLVAEEAKHGRSPPMELAEVVEEAGVVDEVAPVLADLRSAEEVDRLRLKAHEDLHEEVIRENL